MAKPKLALIPASQGSKLYSVLPSGGVGDFDFTRNSSATRINKDGLIETVGSGVSRLNYPLIDGVVSGCPSHILEPERTNLIRYSEDFSQSAWGKINSSIISNSIISPDGTQNADKFIPSSSGTQHYLKLTNTLSSEKTFSFYAKKGEYDRIASYFEGTNTSIIFDLTNGVTLTNNGLANPSDFNIEEYANGWYRCSSTQVGANNCDIFSVLGTSSTMTGDGTSGVYIWGAQLEQGSYATSYIPNYGSALGTTRSAETANGSGDAATFNDSEGVLMAEISALDDDITNRIISLSNGTNSNIISVQFSNAQSNDIIAYYNATGQTGRVISTTSYNIKSFNKTALVWNNSSFKFYVNGYLIGSATIETPLVDGTLNQLKFQYGNSTLPFYGNTKQLQYFDTALSDTDLETLTSWVSFQEMAEGQLYSVE